MISFSSLKLLVLAISLSQHADATCTGSDEIPQVSVKNSTHLNVAWANVFSRNCEKKGIYINRTEVITQKNGNNSTMIVDWLSKDIDIETDPCMRLVIEFKVTFTDIRFGDEESEEFSLPAHYNADYKLENLYSGFFKEKVFDKICQRTNGDYYIPSVPSEVERCIITESLKIDSGSKRLNFKILNPLGQGRTDISGQLERLEKCNFTLLSQSVGQLGNDQQPILAVIIGTSVLFLLLLSAGVICWKWCKNKKKEARGADVNPMYEGAPDYENEEVVNYDMTTTSTRREVKAEVVDRSSIYGEEEDGWENVVVLDHNPYYEC